VDLLEIQGSYPRAHLSRYAALYSTGRHSFTVAYPGEPTALALPMNMMNNLAGGETLQSAWQSSPEPALMEFPVQPRSLAMFRAEQMAALPGGIRMVDRGSERRIINETELELRDAAVVDVGGRVQYRLGTIPPGGSAVLGEAELLQEAPGAQTREAADPRTDHWTDPEPFLERLRSYHWGRPEDREEWRLVAWNPQPHPGQVLRPAVDRHRGLRLVLAHLEYGPPPFFDLNQGEEAIAPYASPAVAQPVPTTDSPETDRP
jgi:hypothetical protein